MTQATDAYRTWLKGVKREVDGFRTPLSDMEEFQMFSAFLSGWYLSRADQDSAPAEKVSPRRVRDRLGDVWVERTLENGGWWVLDRGGTGGWRTDALDEAYGPLVPIEEGEE